MTERIERLLQRAALLDSQGGNARRREELVRRAGEVGYPREYADQLYDVATEENVDPAAALELVICGVGVREFAESPDDQWEESQVAAPPAWVTDAAPAAGEAARERRLRVSFRRLRSVLERQTSAHDAISEFVREPDVGDVDY